MDISHGFEDRERRRIATLYWEAFGAKLGRILGPREKALSYIAASLCPSHAICARDASGDVIGVAGFKTPQGALVDGNLSGMVPHYGVLGGGLRFAALAALGSDTDNSRFLIDGLFVTEQARGNGVGTRLLEDLAREAARRGYREVRLDVIDSNDRARRLYERRGFVAVGRNRTGLLAVLFGFRSATVMVRRLGQV